MIEIRTCQIGNLEPQVALVFAYTPDLQHQVDRLVDYLMAIDCPGIEIVAALVKDEPFKEPAAKNAAARASSCDYLVFTNAGVYPTASLIATTRSELERVPTAIIEAFRLDGTRDYGILPNPFAIGDWQCVNRATFDAIGGYDEQLEQAGGIDSDFLTNAVMHGCEVILLDERVFHSWHSSRYPAQEYRQQSALNAKRTAAKGWPEVIFYYPDKAFMRYQDGNVISLPIARQANSAVGHAVHLPHSDDYWNTIFRLKAQRDNWRESTFTVDTDWPVAEDSPDHTSPDACVRECNTNRRFVSEVEQLFPGRPVRYLDLGCAGGNLVADFTLNGHVAIGLEGSDLPGSRGLFAWPQLGGKCLFTCDISRRFSVLENDTPFKCEMVGAWDVMEHITNERLDMLLQNIVAHLVPGGLFVATISSEQSQVPGVNVEHHLTIQSQEWWRARIGVYMEPVDVVFQHLPRFSKWPAMVWRKRGAA